MALVEALTLLLLSTQPFGPVPFSVAPLGDNKAEVEVLRDPVVQLVFNDKFEIIEINHVEETCERDI